MPTNTRGSADNNFNMDIILKEAGEIFHRLSSLIDVTM
jgi:hypothetical protein